MDIIIFPANLVLKLMIASTLWGTITVTFLCETSYSIKNKNYIRLIFCIVVFVILYLMGAYWIYKSIYPYVRL